MQGRLSDDGSSTRNSIHTEDDTLDGSLPPITRGRDDGGTNQSDPEWSPDTRYTPWGLGLTGRPLRKCYIPIATWMGYKSWFIGTFVQFAGRFSYWSHSLLLGSRAYRSHPGLVKNKEGNDEQHDSTVNVTPPGQYT